MMLHLLLALAASGTADLTDPGSAGISIFSGLGMSAFDEDAIGDWDQCGYAPVGIQFTYRISPTFSVGGEAETTLRDFSWLTGPDEEHTVKHSVAIAEFGAFGRVRLSQGLLLPYLRAGAGIYAGTWTVDDGEDKATFDLDTRPGINLGGGVEYPVSDHLFLGLEGVYHIFSTTASNLPLNDAGFSFWAIRILAGMSI